MGVLRPVEPPSRPPRRDGGSTTLEIVILAPALLLLVFAVVQGAVVFHARHVALAAASEGLDVATTHNATAGQGRSAAAAFLARAGGPGVLTRTNVTAIRTQEQATVTVTGSAPVLLPGLRWRISQTAEGPVERFTSADGGP